MFTSEDLLATASLVEEIKTLHDLTRDNETPGGFPHAAGIGACVILERCCRLLLQNNGRQILESDTLGGYINSRILLIDQPDQVRDARNRIMHGRHSATTEGTALHFSDTVLVVKEAIRLWNVVHNLSATSQILYDNHIDDKFPLVESKIGT